MLFQQKQFEQTEFVQLIYQVLLLCVYILNKFMLNTFYVQQPYFYPLGYQYFMIPTPIALSNTQIINPQIQVMDKITQTNNISSELNQLSGQQKEKSISETESQLDSYSNNEEMRDTSIHSKSNKLKQSKKIQKPNFLVKSTNIQKNYAKAIVQYACRQRSIIFDTLGDDRGQEFLQLMNRLKNRLRNIGHITRYTHFEDFLQLFRILGNNFMKKESVCYIYNSKIQQKSCHLSNMSFVRNSLLKY
ncbi:unnamed protein product [Paramecium sonneborni]|uniref:Transmembrane protein n=1 Tax=Paramecium sonneborni TaxID=65129 RepID=A0A8S1PE21_9CILI|nr:unnamed protein product [Paramecium sonneborni]